MKKVTVQLSEIAAKQFAEVQYSLDFGDGVPTQSQVINHMLEEVYLFEQLAGEDITSYLSTGWPEEYNALVKRYGLNK